MGDLLTHPFVLYSLCTVLVTSAVRNTLLKNVNINPKWITVVVGVILGTPFFIFGWLDLSKPTDPFLLLGSFGIAVLLYDYIVKAIKDFAKRKLISDVFKDNKNKPMVEPKEETEDI